MDYRQELSVAIGVAESASRLLAGAQRDVGRVGFKSNPRDLVTEWDVRSEELIVDTLRSQTPAIPVVGEEGGARGSGGSARWLVDPIDGTVNFAHGLPWFGVSIALEVDGQSVVGVVAAPALGWLFAGSTGHGATFRDADGEQPMRVSSVTELSGAILSTGFPYDRAETRFNFAEWEHMQCTAGACRRLGAASLDLALVARGWLDGYWEARLSPWDVAAGSLLVSLAGGRVTAIDGGEYSNEDGACIASNGAIHDSLRDELSRVRARSDT